MKWFFNMKNDHKKLQIPETSTIQPDCKVHPKAHIGNWVTTGKNCSINKHAVVGTRRPNSTNLDGVIIGDNVTIKKEARVKPGCTVPDGTTIEAGETFPKD